MNLPKVQNIICSKLQSRVRLQPSDSQPNQPPLQSNFLHCSDFIRGIQILLVFFFFFFFFFCNSFLYSISNIRANYIRIAGRRATNCAVLKSKKRTKATRSKTKAPSAKAHHFS
ncbi:hypothetical protein Hanom_Chr09g00837451 [Helianthus anomalus]